MPSWADPSPDALAVNIDDHLPLDTAVRVALVHQPDIHIRDAFLQAARGAHRQAVGSFNIHLDASGGYQHTATFDPAFKDYGATYALGLSKQFYTGTVIELSRSEALALGADSSNPFGLGRFNLSLTQPLLRGRGAEAVAVDALVTDQGIEVAKLHQLNTIADVIATTSNAYWQYLAARRELQIRELVTSRAIRWVEDTKALIAGDARPAADLTQLEATVATRKAAEEFSAQQLVAARNALGLVMGIGNEAIDALPLPSDTFPLPSPTSLAPLQDAAMLRALHALALDNRWDYRATLAEQQQTRTRLTAAERNVEPKLDVQVRVGYGADKSPFGAATAGMVPPDSLDYSAMLVFQRPWHNDAAEGARIQQHAEYRRQAIVIDNLARRIRSAVNVAVSELQRSAAALQQVYQAVDLLNVAVENERKRFQAGLSTNIDIVISEDRLTSGLVEKNQAELRYAQALITLRHVTGTLFVVGTDYTDITLASLTTLPSVP